MNHYKSLFFDVDDTLLDFGATEDLALRLLFQNQGLTMTPDIISYYKKMNKGMWKDFEVGKLTRDELVNTRFSKLFTAFGKTVDGVALEKSYRNFLSEGHQLVENAYPLIETLSDHFDLYIVTNGVADTQKKRLSASGLAPFFKKIFVSEDTGYHKPDRQFFDYVFERVPHLDEKEGLIIGDSLISDIHGGNQAGLDTCWFNAKNQTNDLGEQPTYEIHQLNELYSILNVPIPK
ncbi:YjjG family noncanonical pyrimidine nucleotidase [Sporolactobacillus kofuensis]|uniref:YjjG family noncanonical pyrimidine nucleotidase n=1 Tax=Sporolactobacillus kofuensis TaxID=269672 RepID=A0ABW1WFR9_9BACL|nr:YjjG family noncanonical pyrimidine nucleotidase [Sporolactobacillus kofuensis]MCO7176197.1 YjjG family noncanonical pyrimidine nucleotidase [Sporolactobacillus kofuensis]